MKKLIRILGSLRLAVILLVILSCVLILATICESRTSTQEAVRLFYGAGWFALLLLLLGVNVLCAALTRLPWKRRHLGFLVTHAGIIVILIGSVIGLTWGKEGYLSLLEGGDPVGMLSTSFETLQISKPGTNVFLKIPINSQKIKHLKHPVKVRTDEIVSSPDFSLFILKAYENTEQQLVVSEGDSNSEFNPAVQISLKSQAHGEKVLSDEDWIFGSKTLQYGPMLFRMQQAVTMKELNQILNPKTAEELGYGNLKIRVKDKTYHVPVKDVIKNDFKSDDGVTLSITEYFADFKMDTEKGIPVSISQTPNNPAIQYEISWPEGNALGFVFADYPDLGMVKMEKGNEDDFEIFYEFDRSGLNGEYSDDVYQVIVVATPEKKLYLIQQYPVENQEEKRKVTEIKLGTPISLSTKMNLELAIQKYIPNALITTKTVLKPLEEGDSYSNPALELHIENQQIKTNIFVPWNQPYMTIVDGTPLMFRYMGEKIPLGFDIQLLKFDMPTFEGTDMPASFESLVRVTDSKTGDALERKIWMNHPLTYKGVRISQSGYTRGIGQRTTSTLQLRADPGSPLKWFGSILLIAGMFILYFLTPKKS